jgi:Cysteine dioxygenase type I
LTKSINVVKLIVMLDTYRRAATTGTIDGAASSAALGLRRHRLRPAPDRTTRRLLALATRYSALVGPWAQTSDLPLVERRCELLDRTTDFEVWLIHWPTDGGLVLHDHGGSSGAFHVLWGALDETSTTRRRHSLHEDRLVRSEGKAFGPDYVHSVVNSQQTVATSIHAYSPPLTSMNFYQTSSAGLVLSRVETDWEGAP